VRRREFCSFSVRFWRFNNIKTVDRAMALLEYRGGYRPKTFASFVTSEHSVYQYTSFNISARSRPTPTDNLDMVTCDRKHSSGVPSVRGNAAETGVRQILKAYESNLQRDALTGRRRAIANNAI
jgi:hypothetical protein